MTINYVMNSFHPDFLTAINENRLLQHKYNIFLRSSTIKVKISYADYSSNFFCYLSFNTSLIIIAMTLYQRY